MYLKLTTPVETVIHYVDPNIEFLAPEFTGTFLIFEIRVFV
jgi:hypothetical protein